MCALATTSTKLTSRERVDRFLRRQDQDRVPRCDTFWDETITRWQSEGLEGGFNTVLELLGNDFIGLCWSDAKPFPGQEVTISEDEETRVFRDAFGTTMRVWKHKSGTPEHLGFACNTREDWEKVFKPAMLSTGPLVNMEASRQDDYKGRRLNLWRHLIGLEAFEFTRRIMGDETTLIAMVEDPEWVIDVSRVCTDCVLRDWEAMEREGIEFDGVWVYGDMAYNHGTLCSPDMYEELIWPDHKRLADWAHSRGVPFIFHTDGDVNKVMDLYVAAGFDALQPMESKARMDLRTLAPNYGEKMSWFGNIDVMIMGSNDLERIEHEMRSKFAEGMKRNGYAYHSDHSVPPTVSWDTYQFIIDRVEAFGNYEQ